MKGNREIILLEGYPGVGIRKKDSQVKHFLHCTSTLLGKHSLLLPFPLPSHPQRCPGCFISALLIDVCWLSTHTAAHVVEHGLFSLWS